MKKCSKCNIEKELNQFYLDNSRKDKLQPQCNTCQTQWRQNNKSILNEYSKQYREDNKSKIKEKNTQYRLNNKEKFKEHNKTYRENNQDTVRSYQKEYRSNNKISLRKYQNVYEKERNKNDPAFRLRKMCSVAIRQTLYENNSSKRGKSILKFLPYSIQELKEHLEKQFETWMNWNNQGIYNSNKWNDNDSATWTWQLDHIIPQAILLYSSMEDENFKKCWALSNLRPLSAKQNQIDGSTRIRHKI